MGRHDERLHHWLDGPDGRVFLRRGGLLVGRSPDCDVVIPDPQVSRRHALFRFDDEDRVEVALLGRDPVLVNGAPAAAVAVLRAGDTVSVGGRSFRLAVTPAPRAPEPEVAWVLTRGGGAVQHRVRRSPFTVGGAEDDDLFVEGMPPAALAFTLAQRSLVLEANAPGARCEHPLDVGEVVAVRPGAAVAFGDQEFRVLALGRDCDLPTAPLPTSELPSSAALQFLPRGGRLTLGFGAREQTVWMAERRCDLVAALLKPPRAYAPGELIPDEAIFPLVWPGGDAGRTELNTLVFRARRDLVKADLDGALLIDRQPGGVRFRLADGARVAVGS